MTQESIQLPTTPPLSGADLVANANKALLTLATNFAGDVDPAALAWPYCIWNDTGNALRKQRNAANSAWVTLGPLLTEMATKASVLMDLLATGTASNSAAVILSWADTNYDHYVVKWDKAVPATNDTVIGIRISTDGGSSFVSGDNALMYSGVKTNNSTEFYGTGVDGIAALRVGGGIGGIRNVGQGSSGQLVTSSNTFSRATSSQLFEVSAGGGILCGGNSAHFIVNTSPVNAVRFAAGSGNITSGTFRLYGVR